MNQETDILLIEGLYSLQQKKMIAWSNEEIEHLLVYHSKGGSVVPFFKSLLLVPLQLNDRFLSGLCSGYNPARKNEWKDWADVLFSRGCWLSSIHKTAVKYNLPQIDIWITMPYPRAGQNDFGSIDDQPLAFSKQEDRKKALQWWIQYLCTGFEKYVNGKWRAEYSPPRLRLRGLVWGRESIPVSDKEIVSDCNEVIQRFHLESLWLPNYGSAYLSEWKELGFNHMSIFSNYTGKTLYGLDFLQNATKYALLQKAGIQVVCGKGLRFDEKHFIHYLDEKRIYRQNNGHGPVVYRFPNHSLHELCQKQSIQYHQVYESLNNLPISKEGTQP